MWISLLLLLIIIIGLFFYVKIFSAINNKKYRQEHHLIFEAHKLIGYPNLTDEQQFDILDNENTKHISSLTKYGFVPTGLLDYYLNIEPEKYFIHLKSLNLKEKLKSDVENLRDGFFINQTSKGYEYLFVEKQSIDFRKRFSSYEKLLKYIVYHKLSIYAPRKYKHAWLKKYFV